jgi:molecular chaperone DnaK
MDNAIVEWLCDEFQKETGIDLRKDKKAMVRLREAAEKAKIELSTTYTTDINLPFITSDEKGPKHLMRPLTRAKLEELIEPIIERCRPCVERALEDAKLTPKDIDKIILVGGPTRMPIVQRFVEELVGKKVERGVDPMECVALGAAIQGGIIAGEVKEMLLLDVTPLTLGLETLGGIFTPLIPRNTTIPTRKSQIFTTAEDFQTAVTIHVLQGERPMAADNTSLGRFDLVGIPPAPRGVPQIEVTFDIDVNGILSVTAKDLGTGKEQAMKITAPMKLSKDEIDRMVKEAEKYAEQDRKRREEAELRNQADSLAYTANKTIKDLEDKITKEQRGKVEKKIKDVKEALAGRDVQKIKDEMEELKKVLAEVSTAVYQKAGEERSHKKREEQEKEKSPDEKVVDTEYEVVDEEKK